MAQQDDLLVIGVDVSKAKLDLVWGSQETPQTIENTVTDVTRNLIAKIKDPAKTLVVMEGTGGYESLLVDLLHQSNVPLAMLWTRPVASGTSRERLAPRLFTSTQQGAAMSPRSA